MQRHLPGALLKELTATEDQFYSGFINTRYLLSLSLEQVNGQKMISGHLQNELIPSIAAERGAGETLQAGKHTMLERHDCAR